MPGKSLIWIFDDDRSIRWVLEKALEKAGFNSESFESGNGLLEKLKDSQPDAIISDIRMPGIDGLDLLEQIQDAFPRIPVIIMTAHSDLGSAVKSYKRGAFEYLPKPFDVNDAVAVAQRAVNHASEYKTTPTEAPKIEAKEIIGEAPAMQEVFRAIGRLSHSNITVLIKGESGTGKELVAQALHKHSPRADKPYIPLNVAAIPKDLIESELFGHEKGAFTGATQLRVGRFEQADGGTLFLDEIGDMPMETQTRLLRVLQQGEFTPVGGRTSIKTNVRIIAATHQDLRQLIERGLFREDLFFRLNVVPVRLPPLRERREDVDDLVRHFMTLGVHEGLSEKIYTNDALDIMKSHSWPGNVRELENLVRRIAALHADDVIDSEVVRYELADLKLNEPASPVGNETLIASIRRHITAYFENHQGELPPNGLYYRILPEFEIPLIELTLEATRGNQIRAAELLGLNRNTLRKKIREHGLNVNRGGNRSF